MFTPYAFKGNPVNLIIAITINYFLAFFTGIFMIKKLQFVIIILFMCCLATSCQDSITAIDITQNEETVAPENLHEHNHQARLQTSKDHNKILLLGLITSIFSSVLLFYQLSQKHKKERILEAYAAETRISKKLHDEIANEIYGCLLFVANEEVITGTKKEKLVNQLDSIYLITRNISRENNDIDTNKRFPVQLKLMLSSYSNYGVNIIVKGISKIDWDKIEAPKKIATYRVLQELMVNMQKHSYATVVLIDFSIENKKAKIIYSDNGVGMKGVDTTISNGLKNIEQRLEAINGKAIFDTAAANGFHLTLTFPANIAYV